MGHRSRCTGWEREPKMPFTILDLLSNASPVVQGIGMILGVMCWAVWNGLRD